MFHTAVDGEMEIVVVVHVNDILAHAKDQATIERFDAELGRKCKLKDMVDAKYYMGCHITRDRKARESKLDQHLCVKSMVGTFGINTVCRIPASSGVTTLSEANEPYTPEEKYMLNFPYREVVGALMLTVTMIRSDTACMVRAVARFCENPGLAHQKVVLKVM